MPPGARVTSPEPGVTVQVRNATKWFGSKVAVSDLSFSLGPGVTTLVGPNGAGKSTTLKLLAGLLVPSRGEVRVLGQRAFDNPSLYRRIGLVPEGDSLYGFLTGREFVELAAGLHRLPDHAGAARRALAAVQLTDAADRRVRGFSKGMRQRLKIAQALVHEPEVLILDEPLTGVDPRERLGLMEVFGRLGGAGRTVLISSHILYEAERMGSNVLVIVEGKLAAQGDFHALRELMDDRPRRVRLGCSDPRALAGRLVLLPGTRGVELAGDALVIETDAALELARAVPREAQGTGTTLYRIESLDEDLESVFRYLVRR
ncbi:MAG: ABC transporter ATP-binding protein [Chloroflexi bacterium]|nr:ABC transporter ATP-binding protein [Chloroflexota bacterium]